MSVTTYRSRPALVGVSVLAGTVLGALLLALAELTTLYTVHVATRRAAIASVGTAGHDSYAMIPVAALALVLAAGVWRWSSPARRIALAAIALLGALALILALVHDLPDARSQGLVLLAGDYHAAHASPSAGLYLETLGAVLLIATGVCGLLLAEPVSRPLRRQPARAAASDRFDC